jgi:hypothetical protein
MTSPAFRLRFHFDGKTMGYPVQPTADGSPLTYRTRLAGKQQEGGLKSVLGVVVTLQNSATDAQHHRSVAPQQDGEGRLFTPVSKAREQFAVGRACEGVFLCQRADVSNGDFKKRVRHVFLSRWGSSTI